MSGFVVPPRRFFRCCHFRNPLQFANGACVKNLAIALLLVASACHRQQSTVGGAAGASTPREALDRFLVTARAADYDGMSQVWGSAHGPASATIEKTARQQREFVMMKCLRHDRYTVLSDGPAAGGERVLAVELKFKGLTAAANFTAVQGPAGRWYVAGFKPEELQAICTSL